MELAAFSQISMAGKANTQSPFPGGFWPVESSADVSKTINFAQIKPLTQEQQEHQVLLLKINTMESKMDELTKLVKQLFNDRFAKYVGTKEACKILKIGRTTLMERIKAGEYPFAFQDQTGHWRFSTNDLYRSMGE